MTEKALAMSGTPHTPCGMASLWIEINDGLLSALTPQGAASDGVTREKFCDLANEGFATWFFPEKESIEVEKDWYALYLREDLAKAVGGFNEALGLSLQVNDKPEKKPDSPERVVFAPEKLDEMRERGWVVILGTSAILWRFRKEWAEKLLGLNLEDNLRYLKTAETTLSADLAEKKRLLGAIEKRARFGIYCTEPEVMPNSYLKFALELGLVMMRHHDQDTCRRVYKYHVKRFYPGMSWDEFEKQVTKFQEAYHLSFKELQFAPQLLEKPLQEPVPDGKRKLTDKEKTRRRYASVR
uniref:Uncharacterized protein n=1 Tax=Candidatus Kentrum sp. MB TaxID=2138164 RepID=A0A450XXA7_9GAMM|nr:MAG: hypothetical protein BECKMB1821G_GA0114241_10552 [Candidatus Kentron sp. MB]VFK33896.1 MAG: hypothetical protein BECKMB1821I_GA0114274_10562 [Candidatus Kentron sp. MB]VFK76500.1 MAG: hypothetical protein BECKMB1821H_GA0114242_10602 [Candidatus Kentron sp. MB]